MRVMGLSPLFLLCGQSWAAADPMEKLCASKLPKTEIRVQVDAPKVVFDYSKSTADLTQMRSGDSSGTVLGLTKTRKAFGVNPSASILNLPDGRGCLRPKFAVEIQLNPQTVYIASEFEEGSCAFKQIMAHEMRHVKANQSHAEGVARAYESRMRKQFGNTVFYGHPKSLESGLIKSVRKDWLPYLGSEIGKAEALQQKIDTKAEYERMGTVCSKEIPRTLASYVYD